MTRILDDSVDIMIDSRFRKQCITSL